MGTSGIPSTCSQGQITVIVLDESLQLLNKGKYVISGLVFESGQVKILMPPQVVHLNIYALQVLITCPSPKSFHVTIKS